MDYYDYTPATPPPRPPPFKPLLTTANSQQLDLILSNQRRIITLLEQFTHHPTHVASVADAYNQPTSTATTIHMTTPPSESPASMVDTAPLLTVPEVLRNHKSDINQKRYGLVAVTLAWEAMFGKRVMAECTFAGKGSLKPLPADGVQVIKCSISSLFPHTDSQQFEKEWMKCRNALNHACNSLRDK